MSEHLYYEFEQAGIDGTKLIEIDAEAEDFVHAHLCDAVLSGADGASLPYPPHERCVEIGVDLGAGSASLTVHGSDLTHEYVSINADYRS